MSKCRWTLGTLPFLTLFDKGADLQQDDVILGHVRIWEGADVERSAWSRRWLDVNENLIEVLQSTRGGLKVPCTPKWLTCPLAFANTHQARTHGIFASKAGALPFLLFIFKVQLLY